MTVPFARHGVCDGSAFVARLCALLAVILPPSDADTVFVCGLRSMCTTMVLKGLARSQSIYAPEFLRSAETRCPLPMQAMSRLKGMKTLLQLVKQKKI